MLLKFSTARTFRVLGDQDLYAPGASLAVLPHWLGLAGYGPGRVEVISKKWTGLVLVMMGIDRVEYLYSWILYFLYALEKLKP
jgi:hypothetical protein